MAIDDVAVAAGEHGDLESELPEAAAHAIHSGIVLCAGCGRRRTSRSIGQIWFLGLRRFYHSKVSRLATSILKSRLIWDLSKAAPVALADEPSQNNYNPKCCTNHLLLHCFHPKGGSGGEAQSKHTEGFDPPERLPCVKQLAFGMEPARRFAPWT